MSTPSKAWMAGSSPAMTDDRFWRNESETYGRLPEPSVSNYDAYKWIAGDVISAFLENSLREKSYVW
jgi:hypothetical protein